MPSSFTVTAATNSVLLNNNRRAEASFTVYNASGQSKRGRAQILALEPEARAWFSIQGESERDFNIGGTSQYTVSIVVPSAAPAGSYSFRLNIVGVDHPDEDFTEGQAITFQVPEAEGRRQLPWKIPAIVAAVLVLVIAAGVSFIATRGGGAVQVPDVAGSTVPDATAILEGAGVTVANEMTEETSDLVKPGLVIKTNPSDGSEIESGSEVILFVSIGAGSVIVPEVADSSVIDATTALTSAGFKVSSTTMDEFSNEIRAGTVIRAEPFDGSEFESGGDVILVVSTGAAPLIVPEVADLSVINATTTLTNAGFKVANTTKEEFSDNAKAGMVIGTEPPGEAAVGLGTEITLILSLGPLVVIPDTPTPTIMATLSIPTATLIPLPTIPLPTIPLPSIPLPSIPLPSTPLPTNTSVPVDTPTPMPAQDEFLGNWVNVDPLTGGMRRLVIQTVNDTTLSFQGYGACTPSECDWGAINVPFNPPVLVGTYDFGFKTTRVTVKLSGQELLVENFDDYTADGRIDRTSSEVLKKSSTSSVVHSSGQIDIPQTWTVDLDEGVIGGNAVSDIWFEAETATERYVTPRSGATIAKVSDNSLTPELCAATPLTTQRIDVNDLAASQVAVCVLTNEGRYSVFVARSPVGPSPGTLEITYTTWDNSP